MAVRGLQAVAPLFSGPLSLASFALKSTWPMANWPCCLARVDPPSTMLFGIRRVRASAHGRVSASGRLVSVSPKKEKKKKNYRVCTG